MLIVGVMLAVLMRATGHYWVQGVGYATVLDILTGTVSSIGLLLVLFALKLLATSLTLGSGASGGVFSPSLFMGATLGGAFGIALRAAFPALHVEPAAFALAGMAGLVAGATGAALTAIVMMFEMTLDYSVVLPMTLTVAVSFGLRRALLADSIYTMKLTRRGHRMPQALQANAHLVHQLSELVLDSAAVFPPDAPVAGLDLREVPEAPSCAVVLDGDRVTGVIPRDWALGHRAALAAAAVLGEVARTDFIVVEKSITVFELMAQMAGAGAAVAVVRERQDAVGQTSVRGVISKAGLAEVLVQGMELFRD
jgi:CIC family chloride channel protein